MLLGLKTDNPVAELSLFDDTGKLAAEKTWQADRELARHLLEEIDTFLKEHQVVLRDLTGLFVYQGPGSFTGLRIGLTVMNTLAYSLSIPLVGVQGETWCREGVTRLLKGENDRIVMPDYGAESRVTTPKK